MRSLVLILFTAAAAALTSGWIVLPRQARASGAPAVDAPDAPPSVEPRTGAVTIERRLLRVEVTPERPATPKPAVRKARAEAPRQGLLATARRVVFGDGRYKPSPFPTVR